MTFLFSLSSPPSLSKTPSATVPGWGRAPSWGSSSWSSCCCWWPWTSPATSSTSAACSCASLSTSAASPGPGPRARTSRRGKPPSRELFRERRLGAGFTFLHHPLYPKTKASGKPTGSLSLHVCSRAPSAAVFPWQGVVSSRRAARVSQCSVPRRNYPLRALGVF